MLRYIGWVQHAVSQSWTVLGGRRYNWRIRLRVQLYSKHGPWRPMGRRRIKCQGTGACTNHFLGFTRDSWNHLSNNLKINYRIRYSRYVKPSVISNKKTRCCLLEKKDSGPSYLFEFLEYLEVQTVFISQLRVLRQFWGAVVSSCGQRAHVTLKHTSIYRAYCTFACEATQNVILVYFIAISRDLRQPSVMGCSILYRVTTIAPIRLLLVALQPIDHPSLFVT